MRTEERQMRIQKRCLTALGALALVLGLAGPSLAEGFTRFTPGKKAQSGALQIAQATYSKPGSNVKIVLHGVVHVADKAYFDAVQKDLDAYDVVLWEAVKPSKGAKVDPAMAGIGKMQKMMCEMLGLTFQREGIDYRRKHFVWADIDQNRLQKEMGGKTFSGMPGMLNPEMLKKMGPMMKAMIKSNPAMRSMLKFQFAQQLSKAGSGGAPGMSPEMKRVILDVRNQVVEEALIKQLGIVKEGTIAIFYGAAHMPDLEKRLAKLGYTKTAKSWKNAWSINLDEGELAPGSSGGRSAPRGRAVKPGKQKRWI